MMYFYLMIEFDIVLFPYEKKREKKKEEAMTSLEAQTSSKRSMKIKVQI